MWYKNQVFKGVLPPDSRKDGTTCNDEPRFQRARAYDAARKFGNQ